MEKICWLQSLEEILEEYYKAAQELFGRKKLVEMKILNIEHRKYNRKTLPPVFRQVLLLILIVRLELILESV